MTQRGVGNQTLAAARLAELNGNVTGLEYEKRRAVLRRQIQKWRRGTAQNGWKPAGCLKPATAEWVSRHLEIPYDLIVCKSLSEDERRLRKARRLEKEARELRRQSSSGL